MTNNIVSDEVLGKFARKQADWFERVRRGSLDPEAVSDAIQAMIDMPTDTYLRKVDTAVVGEAKKSQMIADSQGVFKYIDPDFRNWGLNEAGEDTKKQNLNIYEMKKDGNFGALFGSLGDPSDFVVTQGQIIDFCVNSPKKLRQDGYGTFFLIQDQNGKMFVVRVHVDGSGPGVRVYRFECRHVWYGGDRHRLVVPQLET